MLRIIIGDIRLCPMFIMHPGDAPAEIDTTCRAVNDGHKLQEKTYRPTAILNVRRNAHKNVGSVDWCHPFAFPSALQTTDALFDARYVRALIQTKQLLFV